MSASDDTCVVVFPAHFTVRQCMAWCSDRMTCGWMEHDRCDGKLRFVLWCHITREEA